MTLLTVVGARPRPPSGQPFAGASAQPDVFPSDASAGYCRDVLPLWRMAVVGALAVVVSLSSPSALAIAGQAPSAVRAADVIGGPELSSPGVIVHRQAGSKPLPKVDADTWLIADLTTGEVLAAKGAHHRVLPASTLKTLTAITLMPRLDPATVVTATYDEARADGGHVGLVTNATYTIEDLWHGLLLPSGNDAAAALANANGGMATTVSQMQAMAVSLQALDTTVRNDSGLDNPRQFSSAYDMALFARAALRIPEFLAVSGAVRYPFPGHMPKAGAQRSTYMIYGQNRLLLHGYRGAIAGKTGFTSLAHRTFWGAATRGGHTLVVTLFQIHEPTETAARALLDWGFASIGHVRPVGQLVDPVAAPVETTPTSTPVDGATTSAAAATEKPAQFQVPWLPVGLTLVVLVGAALWWRRREAGRAASPSVRGDRTAAPATAEHPGPAPSPPPARTPAPAQIPEPRRPAPRQAPVDIVRPTSGSGGNVKIVSPPPRGEQR